MEKSKRIIHLGGLAATLIALTVYILTLEPTASFWDCGEYIACAYRLEIAHPPGAPIFLLLGRVFSLFAGQNPEKVAYWVNMLSAVVSATTIFFLYHTIVWFVRKAINDNYPYQNQLVLFSAIIGSLAFAFTDSFWFSAVEGEVYATSSLVTAAVFWAILRWESVYTGKMEPASLRWLLLIFFLLGLSIGIHLLNLLAIPAIGLVIYYKTQQPSGKKLLTTLVLTGLILGFIVFIYIPRTGHNWNLGRFVCSEHPEY